MHIFCRFNAKRSSCVATVLTAEEPDVDFLQWLSSTVTQAARSAEEHEVLCAASHALTASIENQFKLSHVVVSCSIMASMLCFSKQSKRHTAPPLHCSVCRTHKTIDMLFSTDSLFLREQASGHRDLDTGMIARFVRPTHVNPSQMLPQSWCPFLRLYSLKDGRHCHCAHLIYTGTHVTH